MSCKLQADCYIIYVLTNKINYKSYVGQTSRTLRIRLQEHRAANSGCIKLQRAIKKYGFENFNTDIISITDNLARANILEKFYIKEYDSIFSGYNVMDGGSNGRPSAETRKLMSDQRKGDKNAMYGKRHTQLAKDNISAKKKGQPSYWKGKSLPQEVKNKLSVSRIGKTAGENNPGAKLTSEQVAQIKQLFDLELTRQQIADMFNISLSAIKRIKAGTHWK